MGGVAVAAAVLIALVAVGAGATGTGQPATPHYVEEAVAAGLDHRYDGDFQYFVGGGVATFDCNDDGLPDAVPRRRLGAGRALRERQPDRRGAPLRAGREPGHRPRRGHRRLPARRRRRRHHRPRGPPGRRERRSCAAWATAASSAPNEALGARRRHRLDGGVRATWEGANTLPTLAFGRYVTSTPSGDATYTLPAQRARPARRLRHAATRAPIAARPRAGARCRCCSATGTAPAARDLRVSNDRHYYTDASGGEEQLWRIEPGERAAALHRRPTAGSRSRSGAWASPARTSPATATRRST